MLQAFPADDAEWNNLKATNAPAIRDACELVPLDAAAIAARLARAPAAVPASAAVGLALGGSAADLDAAAQDAVLTRLAAYLKCPRAWLSVRSLVDGSALLTVQVAPPSATELAALDVGGQLGGSAVEALSAALGIAVLATPSVVVSHAPEAGRGHFERATCGMCLRHRCGGYCGRAHRFWREPTAEPARTACECACCANQCGLGSHAPACRHRASPTQPAAAVAEATAAVRARAGVGARTAGAAALAALGAAGAMAAAARRRRRRRAAMPDARGEAATAAGAARAAAAATAPPATMRME
jgi:hypothetical protein